MKSEKPEFLTAEDVIRLLRISRTTFARHVAAGLIPGAVKMGGQWRFVSHVFFDRWDEAAAHGDVCPAKKQAKRGNPKRVTKSRNGVPRKR